MKRNLYLFFLLIFAGSVAYYFEEYHPKKSRELRDLENRIMPFEFQDIVEIQLSNATIKKKDEDFVVGNKELPIDQEMFNEFIRRLGKIHLIRAFTEQEKQNHQIRKAMESGVSATFKFDQEKVVYKIGEMNPLEDSFYIQTTIGDKETIGLARDTSISDDIYDPSKADQIRAMKYQRVRSMFELNDKFFYRRYILPESIRSAVHSVKINGGGKFDINFDSVRTFPLIIRGLQYNKDFFDKYKDNLANIKQSEIIPGSVTGQTPQRVIMVNGQLELRFFTELKGQKQTGFFVQSSLDPRFIYKIERSSANVFFVQLDDFWDKKIIPADSLLGTKETRFEMLFPSKKRYSMLLPKSENFIVTSVFPATRPRLEQFKNLFALLTATPPFSAAFRAAPADVKFAGAVKKFELFFDQFSVEAFTKDQQLILIQRPAGLALFYLIQPRHELLLEEKNYFD